MRILLLEPYYTGSHRAWAEGYARHSAHQITILSLPGRWWKWRMHGGAVTLARQSTEWREQIGRPPDLLLVTDMLDLTTFLALTREWSAGVPAALYMHENQLTYPLPDDPTTGPMRRQRGERDLHYAFINYASMLAAEAVFFNSQYHLDSWFAALPRLLKHFPDFNESASVEALRIKSAILPLGLELRKLEIPRRPPLAPPTPLRSGDYSRLSPPAPLILWNHRWEYDKDPTTFFRALYALADEGLDFQVAVCGESFRRAPAEFEQARERLAGRIIQWGRVDDFEEYARLLWKADIVVSTAQHDFFGAAMVEAIYCGCRPALPNRLAYPEHIPPEQWAHCLYQGFDGLLDLLRRAIARPSLDLQAAVARYDWEKMGPCYDATLEAVEHEA